MTSMKYFAAVSAAIGQELEADPAVLLLGEDIGAAGGIFAETKGLQDRFGPQRVIDTPAGEAGFVGAAIGAAIMGMRPIVEISFADFFPSCMDQVVNQAAKMRYMSGGQLSVPLTFVTFGGAGLNAGPQHSGTYEAWLGSMPGLQVAVPSTPGDVKGMLHAGIRSDDPTIVILHKSLLQTRGEVDESPTPSCLGRAAIRRPGSDLTIVSWSAAALRAAEAAEMLAADGIEAEVIDLRSVQPLDTQAVLESVRKTGRLLIVQETVGFSGIGAEVAAVVAAEAFGALRAPIARLSAPFTPVPYSPILESSHIPGVHEMVNAARELMR